MPKFLRNIKQMPEVPDRFHAIPRTLYMSDLHGMTLRDLYGKCPMDAIFHDDYDTGPTLTFYTEETDDEFEERIKKYDMLLEEYNKWYENNKANIEYTLEIQEREKYKHKDLYVLNLKTKIRALEVELENAENEKNNISR